MAGKRTDIVKVTKQVLGVLDGCDLGDDDLLVTIEVAPVAEVTKTDAIIVKALTRQVPIFKTGEERYVLGVVLEPLKEMGATDTQNDLYSASEVRQAAYKFMEDYGVIGLQHQVRLDGRVKLLENWIARNDMVVDDQLVKAGTWLMGVRVVDDGLWTRVKDGSLTGFSIGGIAQRTPVDAAPAAA